MNKNKTFLLCLMLGICAVCQAQSLSIKPYVNYHQSVVSQTEPAFFAFQALLPYPHSEIIWGSSFNENFTLSSGFEYGIAVDYRFRNNLGVELGIGYFSSINTSFESAHTFLTTPTNWNYRSIAIRPMFNYAVITGRSAFIGKVGPVFHHASTEMSISHFDISEYAVCIFANRWNFGYTLGVEYNYQLSSRMSLAVNFGYEQHRYTPRNSTVVFDRWRDMKHKINYVNKISGEWSTETILWQQHAQSTPHTRLRESILFNSIYLGIGIKYNIWEK